MHPLKPQFDLPQLRRQLEEILAIVNGDCASFVRSGDEGNLSSVHANAGFAEPGVARVHAKAGSEMDSKSGALEDAQPDKRDDLYDDALIVLTEFGHASPAILQMWLSIDYGRALTILTRFETEGLISSKGRVRHKAFSLLRSLDMT